MNKLEFVAFLAERNQSTKVDAEKALNLIIDGVTASLGKGEEVNLIGFGSFKIQKRLAREGRNPKTGVALKIAASNLPTFKAGKGLKDACN
jgi:nucleoid DNA-binding protein